MRITTILTMPTTILSIILTTFHSTFLTTILTLILTTFHTTTLIIILVRDI